MEIHEAIAKKHKETLAQFLAKNVTKIEEILNLMSAISLKKAEDKSEALSMEDLIAKRAQIIKDFRTSGHEILQEVQYDIEFHDDHCCCTHHSHDCISLEMDSPPEAFMPAIRAIIAFIYEDESIDEILYEMEWCNHHTIKGFANI